MKFSRLSARLMVACILMGIISLTGDPTSLATVTGATVSASSSGFCDYFSSPLLNSGWTWVDPLGDSSFSLTANPGHLRLSTPDGGHDLYPAANLNAPRLVQSISGDFVVTTKVAINPVFNYQGAGLLIWQDVNNYIRLERTLVKGIDMWWRIGGVYSGIEIPFSGSVAYLRLQRRGSNFTASYSANGSSWTVVSTRSYAAANTLQVGLVLINQWQDNPIWADFDFFELDACGPPQNCIVPFYSQRDPRWRNHPLRTSGVCSASCNTIGACGCTLTSATMLFSYYGAELTPPALSDCMGTAACPFSWGSGASCTNGKASNPIRYRFSWTLLDRELNQNRRPVLLGMHRSDNPNDTHWVLVTSGQGVNPSNYIMHDPWPENGANLSLGILVRDNYIFDWLVVYDGQARCTNVYIASPYSEPAQPMPVSLVEGLTGTHQAHKTANVDYGEILVSSAVTGTVRLYLRTELTMTVRLTATSTFGEILDMQVWTDADPNPTWQPFSAYAWLPWYPEHATIYARFQDALGNISDIVTDTTHPIYSPPAEPDLEDVFLPLILR